MIDIQLLQKARLEVTRLNKELRELHLEEERCKLKRARLEGAHTRAQALVDFCDLAQQLDAKPALTPMPFHIEDVNGVKLVVLAKPAPNSAGCAPAPTPRLPAARVRHKPDGLPTVPETVVAMLREAGKPARPSEIANYIRTKWWAELPSKVVYTNAYRMFKDGRLTHADGCYSIAGVSLNGQGML